MPGPVINAKLLADVSGFTSGMKKAGQSLQAVGKSMLGISKKAFVVSGAITALGAIAVKSFAGFEQRMASVGVIAGANAVEFKALEDSARGLGATTLFTAKQAADGMEILAKAGFSVNEILSATPEVLNLAAAASLELGEASDIVIGVMRGFGKEASELGKINDILVKTFTSTNVTVGDIGQTMGLVAPIARTVGIEFEELSAVIGILGNAGIKGTRAGTALRKALISFSAPTPKASRAFKRLGIEVLDAAGNMLPLADIVDQFSGEDGPALIKSISDIIGVRPAAAFAALANSGGASIRKLTKELRNADGTAKKVADTLINTLAGQFTILKSKIESVSISLGKRLAPMMREIVSRAQNFVDMLAGISAETKNTVLRIAALAAGISAAVGVLALAAGAFLLFAGAVLILAGPIAIIALLITLAGALKIGFEKNLGGVRDAFANLKVFILGFFEDVSKAVSGAVDFWKKQATRLADFFQKPVAVEIPFKIAGDPESLKIVKALVTQGFRGKQLQVQLQRIFKKEDFDFAGNLEKVLIKPFSDLTDALNTLATARPDMFGGEAGGEDFDTGIKDLLSGATGEIAETLKTSFIAGLKGIKDLLPASARKEIAAIARGIEELLGKIGQGVVTAADAGEQAWTRADLAGFFDNAADRAENFIDSLKNFGNALLDLGVTIKNVAGAQLKSAVTGLAGSVIQGGIQGAKVGGPAGAIVGAITALLLASKTFTDLLKIANIHLQFVADMLGMFLEPLRPLIAVAFMFVRALLAMNPLLLLLGLVLDSLTGAFKLVFIVIRFFGIILLKIARFFLKLIGKSTKKVDKQLEELENTTFETAGQIDDLGDAAAAAAESLFNVPEGFKVAAARFRAQRGELPGREGGGGPSGGGREFGKDLTTGLLPLLKRVGKFSAADREDDILGTALGAATSGGITIENVTIVANDPDEFLRKLERKAFERRGIPVPGANQFATRRGS